MAWYSKLMFWKKDSPAAGPYRKIVAIRGEVNPGFLSVDVGTFDPSGEPTPDPGVNLQLPINRELRPTVNRILCGQDTPEDQEVLKLHFSKLLS